VQGLHISFLAPPAAPSLLQPASNGHDVSEDAEGEERAPGCGRQGGHGGQGGEGDVGAENGGNLSGGISSGPIKSGTNSSRATCLPVALLHGQSRCREPSGGAMGVEGARGGALEWHLGEGMQGAGARREWEGDGRGRGGYRIEKQEVSDLRSVANVLLMCC
jgi:hypothetical protein